MSPEAEGQINQQAISLLGEFDDQSQLLAGRNFRRLQRLSAELADWRESRLLEAGGFTATIQALCSEQPAGSSEAENCSDLIPDEVVAAS